MALAWLYQSKLSNVSLSHRPLTWPCHLKIVKARQMSWEGEGGALINIVFFNIVLYSDIALQNLRPIINQSRPCQLLLLLLLYSIDGCPPQHLIVLIVK